MPFLNSNRALLSTYKPSSNTGQGAGIRAAVGCPSMAASTSRPNTESPTERPLSITRLILKDEGPGDLGSSSKSGPESGF